MRHPTKTRGAAVAQRGTCWKSGTKKQANKKRMPVTTEARPVRAPSCTPAVHSKNTIDGLTPSTALSIVLRPMHAYIICSVLPGSTSSSASVRGANSRSLSESPVDSVLISLASRFARGRLRLRAMPSCTPPVSKTMTRSMEAKSHPYLKAPSLIHSSKRSWLKIISRLGSLKGTTASPPPISNIQDNAVVRTMAIRTDPLTLRWKSTPMKRMQNAKRSCDQPLAGSLRAAMLKSRPPLPKVSSSRSSVSLWRMTCMT
mmetsp:Transcript_17181/g.37641  ORF Transcript_17181/g.37641 Transcript_17181/m.37641 type:complete len:258 (-) Transcript_17181:558-1331(-)